MIWNNLIGETPTRTAYAKDDDYIIFLGDCKDVLQSFTSGKIDLILTDPPYEFQAKGGGFHKDSNSMRQIRDEVETDTFEFSKFVPKLLSFQSFWNDKANSYFFCNKPLVLKYLEYAEKNKLVSDILFMRNEFSQQAHNSHYTPDIEYVVFIRSPRATFNGDLKDQTGGELYSKLYSYRKGQTVHPNEKPIPLLKKYIMISSNPGDVILDPFMGSGTTLMAARELGRKCIGIDNKEMCVKMALSRLSQRSLFP